MSHPTLISRVTQRLTKLLARRTIILMYHRVVEPCLDPWRLCVTPAHFQEHLDVLSRNWQVLSLHKFIEYLKHDQAPHRSVVITFDDGYACNLLTAKPLLEKYGLSATLFVATGLVGRNREPWWDELEGIMLQPGTLPETLALMIDGHVHRWDLQGAATVSADEIECHRTLFPWNAPPDSRLEFFYRIWQVFQESTAETREHAFHQLRVWAQCETKTRPTHRMMTFGEVRSIADGGIVELGAHTVSHPSLAAHSREYQRREMYESQKTLAELVDQPIDLFAYPHGEYTTETLQISEELGFSGAFTTNQATVTRNAGLLELPRFQVEDWDGDQFECQLRRWMWC